MSNSININRDELNNAYEKMKELQSKWSQEGTMKFSFSQSKGKAVDRINEIIALVPTVTDKFLVLLENSEQALINIDASFGNADESTAERISSGGASGGGDPDRGVLS